MSINHTTYWRVTNRKQCGSAQCWFADIAKYGESETRRAFISYNTIVAVQAGDLGRWYATNMTYSRTTNKQMSTKFGRAINYQYERVSHERFLEILNGVDCPLAKLAAA